MTPDPKGPGQQSVWDYPRPPRLEATARRLRIVHHGVTVADTVRGLRTLETSHPPTYYFPPGDIAPGLLRPSAQRGSFCEWKGVAAYWDLVVGDAMLAGIGWSYAAPTAGFAGLRDHVAFYSAPFDGCFVDGERVRPQPGGFYGGWITADLAGPFKGVAGSQFW
nr:DUF427 domain-containing protein [Polymorphobacter sp.]